MTHEKIFKRPDGSRVKVEVTFWCDSRDGANYRFQVSKCLPGKRTFISPTSTDDYEWRKLSMPERIAFNVRKYLEIATPAEILETKLELWNKLKPE